MRSLMFPLLLSVAVLFHMQVNAFLLANPERALAAVNFDVKSDEVRCLS